MTTLMPKEEDVERKWFVVDAQDRVPPPRDQVATVLRGKTSPSSRRTSTWAITWWSSRREGALTGRKLTGQDLPLA